MKRIAKIAGIAAASIAALFGTLYLVPRLLLPGKQHAASSIGIIGGADGPTSIFIASDSTPNLFLSLLLYGLKAVITICALTHTLIRRRKHKD